MKDKNVRQAAVMSVDKKLLVDRLLRGYGLPIDTLETPEYEAFDPSIKVEYNPEKAVELLKASGYSTENPVKFTIQTTRGFKPKDYEMIQAIVGMWRKVGIEANIEVYEIAKHYELRAADQLAPAAFYNWGNSIGDPDDLDRLCHVRTEPAFGVGRPGRDRRDQPAVGRAGRGQAHRRLEGRQQADRRRGLCAAADPVRAADRLLEEREGRAAQVGRPAAGADDAGLT